MHKLTVELPDPVYQELARIAQLTPQRPEALAAQSISSNLPPSVDNAPLEIQKELLQMQRQSIEELLRIANSKVSELKYQRHVELLEKNQAGSITAEERLELRELGLAAREANAEQNLCLGSFALARPLFFGPIFKYKYLG
ncbi:MAG: hypothetical protein EBE86_020040 [Hormoscilla sp. GUM202]|nr:hypothetical protein [Hormoscilla sp. GUM202]